MSDPTSKVASFSSTKTESREATTKKPNSGSSKTPSKSKSKNASHSKVKFKSKLKSTSKLNRSKSKPKSKSKTGSLSLKKSKSAFVKNAPSATTKADQPKSKSNCFMQHRKCILISAAVIIAILFFVIITMFLFAPSHMDMIDKSVNPCTDFYQRACGKIRSYTLQMKKEEDYFKYVTMPNRMFFYNALQSKVSSSYTGKSQAVRYYLETFRQCLSSNQPSFEETLKQEVLSMIPAGKEKYDPNNEGWMKAYAEYVLKVGKGSIFDVIFVEDPKVKGAKRFVISPSPKFYELEILKYFSSSSTIPFEINHQEMREIQTFIEQLPNTTVTASESHFALVDRIYKSSITIEELSATSGLNFFKFFQAFLKVTNTSETSILNSTIVYAVGIDDIAETVKAIKNTSPLVIKNHLRYRLAFELSNLIVKATGDCYKTITEFSTKSEFMSLFTLVMNRIFVDAYIDANGKAKLDIAQKQTRDLVSDLRESLEHLLQNATWLDEPTRMAAVKKLKAMQQVISYEDWIFDDEKLDKQYGLKEEFKVVEGSYIQSIIKFHRQAVAMMVQHVGEKPSPKKFQVPFSNFFANAVYSPMDNGIGIPLGFLQPPLFEVNTPIGISYGSVGAIIGHEITHGFDSNGRRFNDQGRYHDWWSKESATKFNERAMCFIKQYSAIVEPTTGLNLNGRKTLGEDIADNGGLKEAYMAFQKRRSHSARAAIVKGEYDGYSDDELFFYAYAHNFCHTTANPDTTNKSIQDDTHTLSKYRVNVPLSNFEPFAKTFKCAPGTAMNPVKKCAVW